MYKGVEEAIILALTSLILSTNKERKILQSLFEKTGTSGVTMLSVLSASACKDNSALGSKAAGNVSAERRFKMQEHLKCLLGGESKLKDKVNKTNSWAVTSSSSV